MAAPSPAPVNETCFFPKGHVYIADKLPPDLPYLDLHCKSKDDDLGKQTLTIDGIFHFSFCENPFSTVFYCQFWWNGKTVGFNVYEWDMAKYYCKFYDCYYEARADGIYFSGYYPPRDMMKWADWPPA
ncbi:S-protein homolog 5-like [Primulina huaijiensis]|uniref:S-protein homolog 5-like n=1 Tax=Primulina huaijiensis TaxID=1492673 RepID=UPI003CC77DE3